MKELKVKPIKVPAGYKHPPAPHPALPNHEFTMGLIAPKGAGKTTVICNLLEFYKGYFHTILVFSPTIQSDEKWDVIKKQKLVTRNVVLQKWLKEMRDKKNRHPNPVVHTDEGIADDLDNLIIDPQDFDGMIPEEHFFDGYDDESFREIMEEQMEMIKLLKKHGKPKFWANRILIIFDDLVGSALFSGTRGSYFKGVNTRHRHYSASFIMVSQGYKEIPKTIRTNLTCLIIFEIGNEKELEAIYEEWPMFLKKNEWMDLYEYAVKEPYAFMYFNSQKEKKNMRIMRNFDQYLFLK